jgi:hypothetical protein
MFKLTSAIKAPEGSITVGLAEAAAVYVIYQSALPSHIDIRAADPHNRDVEAARKAAAWKSAAVLGVVFLMTKDVNSFLIGGLALGGIDMMVKHANGVHPGTGKLAAPGAPQTQQTNAPAGDNAAAFPLPDYADTAVSDMGY